jgi:hypothetical protein
MNRAEYMREYRQRRAMTINGTKNYPFISGRDNDHARL